MAKKKLNNVIPIMYDFYGSNRKEPTGKKGLIDFPNDSTDPSKKYKSGKLCFPSQVADGENRQSPHGIKTIVPDTEFGSNNISGDGRGKWSNLYDFGDEQGSE